MKEQEKENAIQYLQKTKSEAMKFYAEACEDVEQWQAIIEDCDDELIALGQVKTRGTARTKVLSLIIIITILVIISILVCSCNTVYGVGRDLQAVSKPYLVQE